MNVNLSPPAILVKHVPKGHMCSSCVHMFEFEDCSGKSFNLMPPIEKSFRRDSGEEFIIVRCTDYVKGC